MKCPACNEPKLVVADRHGVSVDYCPECRGVWLDRGELDKIIARDREQEREHDEHEEMRERTVERAERHRAERQDHLASHRRDSNSLVQRIFDF